MDIFLTRCEGNTCPTLFHVKSIGHADDAGFECELGYLGLMSIDSMQRLRSDNSAFPVRINTLQKPGNDLCGESYAQDVVVFTVSYHSKVMQNRTQEDNDLSIVTEDCEGSSERYLQQ